MSPILPNYQRLLLLIVAITVIVVIVWMFLFKVSYIDAAQKTTFFTAFVSVPLWLLYEKWGWRYPLFRGFGWLCNTPDLNGRWEGTIDRKDARGPHKIVLEISQTWTNIQCVTYSETSHSTSLSTEVLSTIRQDAIMLVFTTEVEVGRDTDGTALKARKKFYLTTILWFNSVDKSMQGEYFTSRDPQTRGEMILKFISTDLMRSYHSL